MQFIIKDTLLRSPKYIVFIAIILFIMLARIFFVSINDTHGGRTNWRGDGYSELGAISAANYWLDYGYLSTYLRPMYNYEPGQPEKAHVYLHFPPFSEFFTSVAMHLTQSRNLKVVRFIPLALSFLFVLLLTKLLKSLLKNDDLVFWILAAMLSANYFLAWADNLYIHMLAEIFKVLYVVCLYSHYKHNKPWTSILGLAAACLFLGQISPTYIIFCAVVTVGFSLANKKGWARIFAMENILLGLGFVGAAAIHMGLNTLYLGSLQACLEDFKHILQYRGQLPWSERILLPIKAIQRIERMYLITGWSMFIFHYFYLRYFKDQREFKVLSWILLAAGFTWYIFMAQHANVHSYVAHEAGLYIVFVGGIGSWAYFNFLRTHWQSMHLRLKILNGIFSAYVVGMAITQQIIPMWWRHGLGRLFSG